jgi:hypothetical protein
VDRRRTARYYTVWGLLLAAALMALLLAGDVLAGSVLVAADDGGAIDRSVHGAVLGIAQALAAVGVQEVRNLE